MSENSGPVSKTISGNEYSFYANYNPSVNNTPEERTLYTILQQKVVFGGIESLNKTGMHSKGVIYNQQNSANYVSGGAATNPHIANNMEDATRWANGRELTPVSGKPGLYQDQSWAATPYVFVLQTAGRIKDSEKPFSSQIKPTAYTPPIITPARINPPNWGSPKYTKPPKPVMKKVAQDYDLLFNSLDYTKTYQEEIDRLSTRC
jgi:hypothetical protein